MYSVKTVNESDAASTGENIVKPVFPKKKADVQQKSYRSFTDEELAGLYPMMDISALPEGIRSMLKGLVEGYTYYQLMCMVLFFKRSQYSLEQILD